MKKLVFLFILLFSATLAFSASSEKVYINPENIIYAEEGIYFQYEDILYFTKELKLDNAGVFFDIREIRIVPGWWCTNCRKWKSNELEVCDVCGERK